MKKIYKIVLTGGPCAGKTTLISKINEIFPSKGFRVFTINETATELISNGLKPFGNCIDLLNFQDFVFKNQFNKEQLYMEAANLVPEEKVLIICDRGILDNKAYINDELFQNILKKYNKTETDIRDKYNGVIHLVTAADGAPEAYNLDNAARTETIEQAIALDKRTLNAWLGHPHLKVIDNSVDFYTKMTKAINEIYAIVGEPIPIQIQKKFLVEIPELKYIENYKKVNIIQTYLKKENDTERRLRQRGVPGDYVYFYTCKKKISDSERAEIEKIITPEEYLDLLLETDNNLRQILKERYCFLFENQYFELDIFPFNSTKALLEINLTNKNDTVKLPDYIKTIKEVTDDEKYYNYNISRNLILN